MTKRTLRSAMALAMLTLLALMSSCIRRPLYIEDSTPVKVIVAMDWFELGSVPEGASIYFYPEGGGAPYVFPTNSVSRTVVQVPAGFYTVMVFNRTPSEFYTFAFHDMSQLGMAGITLHDRSYSWIDSRQDTVGRTVYEPEAIVVGRTDHFQVHSLVWRVQEYKRTHADTRASEDELSQMDVNLDSVFVKEKKTVYTSYVTVKVKGIQNVKSVRGYLNGMAGGIYLGTRNASDSLATFAMENWTINRDQTDYTVGTVNTSFNCFGLPEMYLFDRAPENNHFVVRFLLVDNQTIVTRSFDVGEDLYQNDNELVLDLELNTGDEPLPDVEPEGGGATSGFDVTIEDWGDTISVVVPF